MICTLLVAVLLLAFANGANDNFNGVATLAHPFGHPQAWIVTLTFALFFVVAYFASGQRRSLVREA